MIVPSKQNDKRVEINSEKLGRGRWFRNKQSRNDFQSNPLEDVQEQEQSSKYIIWFRDTYTIIRRMGELTQRLLVQYITYSVMNNLNR